MPQFLKQYGEQLVALGYTVLPIRPGTKRPDLKNWPNHETTAADVVAWYSNGRAAHGAGINARNAPAIDVDVLDPDVAQQMSDAIDAIFPGERLMTRTGLAPKFLVPFRSDTPFRKMTSHVYTDGKHEHKVEILGDGQQWVAYHIHPDTERPYQWFDGCGDGGIVDVRHEALPVLGRESAQRVIDAFERIAAERVERGLWRAARLVPDSVQEREAPAGNDPFAADAPPVTDLSRSQIEWLVHKADSSDYETWIDVGMRLHHQYAGGHEGFEIWDAWSANSHKYDADVMQTHWDSFGHRTDAPKTIRGLLDKHGQPPVDEHKPAPPHPQAKEGDRVPFVEGTQFAEGFRDIDWLIEDVVPRAQVGVIYGASGSGKTFFALDMACAIQRGGMWRGKHVEQCDAFYIAAEAGNGIKKRIAAYLKAKGKGAMPWFVDYQPNLATMDSVQAISESVKLRSDKPGVIFVDTMALSHDGDENSSKDMSLLLRHCKILSDNTGALVILVHHTGKDESRGMRGSSAIYAGADFVLEISAQEKDHEMVVDKLKDGERGARFGFRLPAVEVGTTPRGKVITSCYVEETNKTLEKGKKGRKPLTNQAQIYIFDVFNEALGMSESMTETELVEAVKAKQRSEDNAPSQSQSIKGSINRMVNSGHFCKEDERISLPHSTHSTHSISFK